MVRLETFLFSQQADILDRWFNLVLADYPSETANYFGSEKDPFANPVGSGLRKGLRELLEELLQPKASEKINNVLEQVLKIRAVQDFSPSRAVGFPLYLKQIIREMLAEKTQGELPWQELMAFESKIDALTLLAFDIYTNKREQLYLIRIKELKESIPRVYRDAAVRHCSRI
jgi:hypothetical protein